MYYDTVIFDLDGTLLDTLPDLHASTNYALRANGLAERELDEVRRFVGNGILNLIKRAVPEGSSDSTVESVFACFKEHYGIHSKDMTVPYDGINDLLVRLKKQGVKLGVVSNKAQFAVTEIIAHYFSGVFDVAFGEREGVKRKPAPDGVLEAAELLGGSKVLYVGDSDVDVATAANAHFDLAAVTWGFRSKKTLRDAGACCFADTADALYEIVKEGADAYSAN